MPASMAVSPTARMAELGIVLPPAPPPAAVYAPVVVEGGLAWVSGQVVTEKGSTVAPGLVDRDVSVVDAQAVARRATLQALAQIAQELGSIDRVVRVVRVVVYVASSDGFTRQHEVANGATQVLIDIFGEPGRPARVSIGVAALPLNASVEVELLAAVR